MLFENGVLKIWCPYTYRCFHELDLDACICPYNYGRCPAAGSWSASHNANHPVRSYVIL